MDFVIENDLTSEINTLYRYFDRFSRENLKSIKYKLLKYKALVGENRKEEAELIKEELLLSKITIDSDLMRFAESGIFEDENQRKELTYKKIDDDTKTQNFYERNHLKS